MQCLLTEIFFRLHRKNFLKDFSAYILYKNFCTKDFLSKCEQIRGKLRIWLHILKKSLIENLIFCAMAHAALKFSDVFSGCIEKQHRAVMG